MVDDMERTQSDGRASIWKWMCKAVLTRGMQTLRRSPLEHLGESYCPQTKEKLSQCGEVEFEGLL